MGDGKNRVSRKSDADMIKKFTSKYLFEYEDYDRKNSFKISLTVLSRKIGQVWKIDEILDFDMGEIEENQFFGIVDPRWFIKLKGFIESST